MPQINFNQNPDKVLLVDDEIEVTLLVAEVMREQGFLVETAASGIDALRKMESFFPDVIISDIKMPVMDGFEFCQHVREHPQWQDIPFIFLSAVDNIESIRSGRIAGADEYLVKPYDIIDIILAVQTKLERIRSLRGKYKQEFENIKQEKSPASPKLESLDGFKDLVFQELEQTSIDEIRTAHESLKNLSSPLERALKNLLLYFEFKLLASQSSSFGDMKTRYILDLRSITKECVDSCQQDIQTKNIELSSQSDEKQYEFHISGDYIKHLIYELLDNAITSAPSGSGIRLTVCGTTKELLLSLCVDGLKNPNSVSRTSGLMMARAITEYHNGKFSIQPGLSGGIEYLISLPC
jgi:two-component system, sensor histidine kinase and response regulator